MRLANIVVVVALVGTVISDPSWELWFSQTVSTGLAITVMTGAVFLRVPNYIDLWTHCRTRQDHQLQSREKYLL